MSTMPPQLWLVIPAWREAERLETFATRLLPALANSGLPIALQIVDDGSPAVFADTLDARCRAWGSSHPFVQPLLRLPRNRGKGAAIYAGWDLAVANAATRLGFCDADGSVDADEMIRLSRLALDPPPEESEVLLASRHWPGARARWSSPLRRVLSRAFVAWVRNQTGLAASDTQCGAKFLPAALYVRIRPELRVERFAFDVELLTAARRVGASLREEPVAWAHRANGRLNLMRDGFSAMREVVRIGRRG